MVEICFIFLPIMIIISMISMQIIEGIAVDGWQDENGFHLGREEEGDSDDAFSSHI